MKAELGEAQEMAIAIRQETEKLIRASLAPNTLKAYQKALKGFAAFLKEKQAEFSDTALSAYLTPLYSDDKSPSTISIVVAAVKWQLRNENKSRVLPITDTTLAGIRRKARGRGQVDGLDWQAVERVCAFAEAEKTLSGLRDAAMIRLMSDCLLRISEAVAVDGFIAGHSLRVGSAVSLAQAGATVIDMQVAGRWRSSQMPAHYAKAELAERGAIARFKEGKR